VTMHQGSVRNRTIILYFGLACATSSFYSFSFGSRHAVHVIAPLMQVRMVKKNTHDPYAQSSLVSRVYVLSYALDGALHGQKNTKSRQEEGENLHPATFVATHCITH
jgi:phosphate/sulfate permease